MNLKNKISFLRSRVATFKKAIYWLDLFAIFSVLALFLSYLPREILNSSPATGGDTGSHFWPLYTLVKEGLPHWHVRVWNPGNLGGEPHLTHYFPLPYFVMAFLSLFMPLGRAFNLGTILPVGLLPICVYFCFRGLKARFPIPLLAMVASLSFLYNESFSMWGGNTLSTLAGQFAHVYALGFFLLGLGVLNHELTHRRWPVWSGVLFAFVLLSHFYVGLMLPIVFIIFLWIDRAEPLTMRFRRLFVAGLITLTLSAWFVFPMLHNSQWTTAFGLQWATQNILKEVFPKVFWPFAGIVAVLSVFFIFVGIRRKLYEREWKTPMALCLALIFFGSIYYFIFPKLGLVDVRVLPILQLFLVLIAAIYVGIFLRRLLPLPWIWAFCVPLIGLSLFWAQHQVVHFPSWMKWNYSGWEAKSAYPDLQSLAKEIQGDFSDPRVIYENNELSNSAGTIRVFEMLPYFAGRSVLEGVYMQATILAPAAFYLQALISKTPSCPFPNYQCTGYKVESLKNFLDLMGVSQLILMTPEVRAQADQTSFLDKQGDFGIWHLYKSKIPVSLVGVLETPAEFLPFKNYKERFYDWFQNYHVGSSFLIVDQDLKENEKTSILQSLAKPQECHPQVQVQFDRIHLKTDCPGKFHYLKFAFHSTWQVSTKDKLYLISPGFIGLIPSQTEVVLSWGHHWLWTLSNTLSWFAIVLVILLLGFGLRKRRLP